MKKMFLMFQAGFSIFAQNLWVFLAILYTYIYIHWSNCARQLRGAIAPLSQIPFLSDMPPSVAAVLPLVRCFLLSPVGPLTAVGLCTVFLNQRVYAIGGCNSHSHLCSVERYDIVNRCWQQVPSMGAPQGLVSFERDKEGRNQALLWSFQCTSQWSWHPACHCSSSSHT